MQMKTDKIKYGLPLTLIEILSLGTGFYWLLYVDATSLLWNSIIVLITVFNISLYLLHPKYFNLFYTYYFINYRINDHPSQAVDKIKGFMFYAIGLAIFFYLISINFDIKTISENNVLEIIYVLSYIIYQLSFLRGGEEFIRRVESNVSREPVKI